MHNSQSITKTQSLSDLLSLNSKIKTARASESGVAKTIGKVRIQNVEDVIREKKTIAHRIRFDASLTLLR